MRKYSASIWPIVGPLITIMAILSTSAILIAYGRGYRLGFKDKEQSLLRSTGLISATSDPVGAQIFIDGKLSTATNNSVNIDPGVRIIRMTKEGYLPWEKTLMIEKEVVSRADAFLFPVSPSLSPLTSTGIKNPVLSPDGTKIAYIVPEKNGDRNLDTAAGIWIYELSEQTFGFNRDPKQLIEGSNQFDLSTATLVWSPDSRDLLITTPSQTRLYKNLRTSEMQMVTNTLGQLLNTWETQTQEKQAKQLLTYKQDIINIATSSAKIISFSPDESKILYEATASATLPQIISPPLIGTNSTPEERAIRPGNLYVYDAKEDKNYFLIERKEFLFPTPTPTGKMNKESLSPLSPLPVSYPISWFPTSRHLMVTMQGKIDILEYDRTNWITVYAGPFVDSFVSPWPTGSRIIVLTNLNPGASALPNLYTVNLR